LRELDCGLSYRAGDAEELATALRRLATDSAYRAGLSRNSLAAFERYDSDEILGEMAEFLIEGATGRWAGRLGGRAGG
jgi:hypothetical protein